MRQRFSDFERVGVNVVAVGMGSPTRTAAFRAEMELPFPVLCDPRREAYRRYRLMRADFRRELTLGSLTHGLRDTARHGVKSSPDQDMLQLGGVFVVAPDGRLAYTHRALRFSDNPPVDDLLRAARGLRVG